MSHGASAETRWMHAGSHRVEYYWTRPRKDGEPVLVFLHEGLGSARLWRDFPATISDACDLPGLVYSRYGHGASDVLKGSRSANYMHEEALESLPALRLGLGLDDVILIGHSDGASIALIHASSDQWPVRSVILEAPHVFVEERTVAKIRKTGTAYRNSDLGARLNQHHADGARTFFGWSRIWLDPSFRSWNIEACLQTIRCPMLVIQGREDEYGTMRQVDSILRHSPGPVETCILDDCRHAPHHDQPQAVCRRVSGFVRRQRNRPVTIREGGASAISSYSAESPGPRFRTEAHHQALRDGTGEPKGHQA